MKTILKKMFRTLAASAIILIVGTFISLLINLLAEYCPAIFAIFAVFLLLFVGYIWGNKFVS